MKNKLFFFAELGAHEAHQQLARRGTYSLAPADAARAATSAAPASPSTTRRRTRTRRCARRSPATASRRTASTWRRVELIEPHARCRRARLRRTTTRRRATGDYKRDNIDAKVNFQASSRMSLFGALQHIRPRDIIDPSVAGRGGRRRAERRPGRQRRPGRTHVAGVGGTYTFGPNVLLDANVGYTRQRLGAENVDIDTQLRPGRAANPRHQRPRPAAGRHPVLPDQRLGQPRQPEHRQPVPVRRQAVRGLREPAVDEGRARAPRSATTTRTSSSTTSSRRAGRSRPRAARSSSTATRRACRTAPAPAGHALQQLGGLPARPAERRRQGGAAPQPELASACRRTRSTPRTAGRSRATSR